MNTILVWFLVISTHSRVYGGYYTNSFASVGPFATSEECIRVSKLIPGDTEDSQMKCIQARVAK